uniref:Uncharacterized protein n=1 Tax=candidate division WOR-3 bacterium TaxID=2052148 RepID=A0A7C4TAL5_UNCW3
MNLIMLIIAGLNLYFLRESADLLVKYLPEKEVAQVIVYYSFSDAHWDSVIAQVKGDCWEAVITSPETLNLVGIYIKYPDGIIDDNKGMLYCYEVKRSPRMILPLSISDLEAVLKQARKKIAQKKHLDEAITLLEYVDRMLEKIPYRVGTELEIKRNVMSGEVEELKKTMGR